MKPDEEDENLTWQQRRARLFERLENGYYGLGSKPNVSVMSLPVSEKIAEAVRANPNSVRVSARGEDGIAVVEGPKANPTGVTVRVDLVRGVDRDGRPVWPVAGAVHEYNPLDALKKDDGR